MNAFEFDDDEETKVSRSSRSSGRSKRRHRDDDDDDRRPVKKPPTPMKPILLIGGGILAGMVLMVVIALAVFGSKATKLVANSDKPNANSDRKLTVSGADEEFRVASSKKSERASVVAKMLIDFRNNDMWPWERLTNEVDFQFGDIKAEFGKWKRERIAAGDRYK